MTTTARTPTILGNALLLHQAAPFQKLTKGKRDALSNFVLEESVAFQAKQASGLRKGEDLSAERKNTENFSPYAAISSQDVDKAAVELASFCFGALLNSMFSSLEEEGGASGAMWRSMLVEQYGKFIATSPVGRDLYRAIKEEISALQKDATNGDSRIDNTHTNDRFNG
ncbi:MAG: hypothetical protein LBD15_01640 [Holosporales bacterium]|jgi:hypothetical protein|nr:hypothetical protein [Holosporales bacterium]